MFGNRYFTRCLFEGQAMQTILHFIHFFFAIFLNYGITQTKILNRVLLIEF